MCVMCRRYIGILQAAGNGDGHFSRKGQHDTKTWKLKQKSQSKVEHLWETQLTPNIPLCLSSAITTLGNSLDLVVQSFPMVECTILYYDCSFASLFPTQDCTTKSVLNMC